MAKAFTVTSWNEEHFKNNAERIDLVVAYLETHTPDVLGLSEEEYSRGWGSEQLLEIVNG